MKLDSLQKNNFQAFGDRTTLKFGIDVENMGLVYKAFINYSNSIGSLIREVTSNCFDSHIEAGVTRPITVKITNESYLNGTPATIHFIDYGVGLSKERVENIYCKFFTSTKRDTNDLIGSYGLGAKSPLGYVDMFYVKTVYNNIQYTYIVHKGEDAPEMDLIEEIPTTQGNGTEVIVNIKDGDKHRFLDEIKLQLKYFDNIEYINCGNNDYTLTREGSFIYNSGYTSSNYLDLCVGKVRYPLDINTVQVPISFRYSNLGLYFDIGEIDVVWNREAVDYNTKTITAIQKKLDEGIAYIVNKIESSRKKITTLDEFLELYRKRSSSGRDFLVNIAGRDLDSGNFVNIGIKYVHEDKAYTFHDISTLIQVFVSPSGFTDNGRVKPSKNMEYNVFDASKPYIVKNSTTPALTYKIHQGGIADLYKYNSDDIKTYPLSFQKAVKEFVFRHIPVYDDIPVTDHDRDLYRAYLAKNRKQKVTLSGDITYYPYTNGGYNRRTDKASDIFDYKNLYVIGPASDSHNLGKLSSFLSHFYGSDYYSNFVSKKGKIKVVHFSKENYDTISNMEIPNVIFYGDFLSSKYMTRLIQRMADYATFRDISADSNFNETFTNNHFVKLYRKWNIYFQNKKIPSHSELIKTLPPAHPELVALKHFYIGVHKFIEHKAPLFPYIHHLKQTAQFHAPIKRDYDEYMKRFKLNNYTHYATISKHIDNEKQ